MRVGQVEWWLFVEITAGVGSLANELPPRFCGLAPNIVKYSGAEKNVHTYLAHTYVNIVYSTTVWGNSNDAWVCPWF